MEQLYVLGTGNAVATACYNTCFAIKNREEYFLVDTGGGNGILKILGDMGISVSGIHHIFITHNHTDHILGIVWLVRVVATSIKKGSYDDDLYIYCHEELAPVIDTICKLTLQEKFYILMGERIHLVPVSDGETRDILDYPITFFDIHSTKAKQFGFTTILHNGKKLSFTGDEPCNSHCEALIQDSQWLLHEAFCLDRDQKIFRPYEKHHSTVKDACELASRLNIPNLVLWHTEDKSLPNRKENYTEEGRRYYNGNLLVPDDGEVIALA